MNHIITLGIKIPFDYVWKNKHKQTINVIQEEHYIFDSYREAKQFKIKNKHRNDISYINYSECH